jgi:hypothetical protein
MRNVLVVAALGMMLVGAGFGCNKNKSDDMNSSNSTQKMSSMKDDCPMCPGVQHASADGTCPKCGMKVKG